MDKSAQLRFIRDGFGVGIKIAARNENRQSRTMRFGQVSCLPSFSAEDLELKLATARSTINSLRAELGAARSEILTLRMSGRGSSTSPASTSSSDDPETEKLVNYLREELDKTREELESAEEQLEAEQAKTLQMKDELRELKQRLKDQNAKAQAAQPAGGSKAAESDLSPEMSAMFADLLRPDSDLGIVFDGKYEEPIKGYR